MSKLQCFMLQCFIYNVYCCFVAFASEAEFKTIRPV